MPTSIKAILFDHDGTLVDSETTHYQLWNGVLEPYGVSLSSELYGRHCSGTPTTEIASYMVDRFGLRVRPSVLAGAKESAMRQYLLEQAYPLMPGALDAIRYFRNRGLRLGLVSGAIRESIEASLRAHNIVGIFATVVSADDVLRTKPAPDCYLLALQRLGVDPAECLAVEDTESGVAAAAGANITCLAVPSALAGDNDFSAAKAIFQDLAEATRWVAERL